MDQEELGPHSDSGPKVQLTLLRFTFILFNLIFVF